MDLSNDLISKFVKITNDDKNKNSESTVYGTVVEYNGGMYVRIDGSDLLTPVETTADFKPNERVTVMIKNHSATVTGNITSPSTNEGVVIEKVTEAVEDVEGKVITEVEILIADRVSTKQLDAEVARIDELIAGKASVEDLTATNAEITNLKADKASIKDLTATNAEITNLKAKDAEIENLVADKATIEDLTATNARIDSLQANKADITYLDANFATIDELEAAHAEIEILDSEVADINTLVNGNLTSDNILSLNITSQNTTMENAFVKDAMIDTVTANKIMSGTIDTNNVTIQSTDGSMLLQGTLLQMKDDNGKVRIQIGKDTGGNFTFILYDESGTGVLIDEEGIKSSDAIADGLIVDAKVADNANIAGSKLDIASVITEVNNDNSTTIKSNKIYLDEQGQSLEVAFNSLKTHVDTIQDVTIDGDLTVVKEQVQSNTTQIAANKEGISTLVSENTIRKEEIQNLDGEIESVNNTLSSKYSSLEQDVSGFKTTVADTYTTKSEFNNLQIGGTNLMRYSKPYLLGGQRISNKWNSGRGTASVVDDSRFDEPVYGLCMYSLPSTADNAWMNLKNEYGLFKVTEGDQITISMKYLVGDNCRGFHYIIFNDKDEHKHTFSPLTSYPKNVVGYTSHTWVSDYTGSIYLCIYNSGIIDTSLDLSASPSVLLFSSIKIEKGNKATAWSPAPEDVQGQIDATNNNHQNNYSTTSAMNSAIQQKANEITSSVSQTYISNYEAKKLADTTTTGLNKYLFERYQRDGFDYVARPTLNDLVGARLIESRLVDSPPAHTSDLGDTYIGVLTFYLYYDYACTKTVTITTDDAGTVYLNNVGIYELTSCIPANVTFNMIKGLNRIDIIYAEGRGGDGVSLGGVDGWSAFGAYANVVTNEIANRTNELTLAMTQGNMLYTDPTFRNGENYTFVYNNLNNNTVIKERIVAIEGCPNTSGYCLKITTNGEATPGLGGFAFGHNCRYNAVFITKITAKIPVGYWIEWASNAYGDNGEQKWLSSKAGTGDWYDYYCKVKCGDRGSINNTNYFYLIGPQASAENPVTWYVSYATVFDVTDSDERITNLTNNLAVNYSTTTQMNSAIQQKANEITSTVSQTYATKQSVTDVNNKLANNYSTTTQMNSAIQQKANEITSSVSETYTTKSEFNNLQIGGKNLLLDSKREITNNGYYICSFRPTELFEVGEKYTMSICVTPANGVNHIQPYISGGYASLSAPLYVNGATKQVLSRTFTFNGYASDRVPVDIYDNSAFVQFYRFPNDGTVTGNTTLHWVKMEKGAKATDWSPAPEDVQGQIDATNNNLQNNYSTTSAMNSAIQQKANEITSSVSETYTTKSETTAVQNQITTSRNLLMGSRDYNLGKWGTDGATILDEWYNGARIYTTSVAWASMDYYVSDLIDRGVIELFTPYTFSCYVMSTGSDYTPNILFFGEGLPNFNNAVCGTASTTWQRISITLEWSYLADRSYGIRFEAPTPSPSGSHLRWACFQLERGKVATGWGPAPEDAQYGINEVNNNLVNNYSTTSQMNSAIQQKANEITSSVSETYATKQSVTDVSNNLSTNYSTTSAMNSAINQKANEITSSVSQTYTTKTEFDNLKIGARNYVLNSGLTKNSNNFNFNSGVSRDTNKKTPNGNNSIYFNISGLTGDSWRSGIQGIGNKLEVGKTYTIGANVFVPSNHGIDRGASLEIICWNSSDARTGTFAVGINTSTVDKWQSLSRTFTVPANTTKYSIAVYVVRNGKLYAGDYSLVEGNKSIWTPAPEDVQGQIDATNNNLQNNYSTTSAMNSAIQQKANEITSSVSQTYATKSEFDNLEIGGTNLARQSNIKYGYLAMSDGSERDTSSSPNSNKDYFGIEYMPVRAGDIFTITSYNSSSSINGYIAVLVYDTSKAYVAANKVENTLNSTTPVSKTFTIANDGYIRYTARGFGELNVKLEKGNKATDWSPAPEDVQGQIDATNNNLQNNYSTTSAMNSAINQKANEITSSVSQTYATKQSVTDVNNKFSNYSTTSQMNSAINQKANAITSSVSQTYATKQSVTDVSNNLANNYSTTTSMNSAIQQKANDLTIKFTESGGYNLLQNGHADKGTGYWIDNGGGITTNANAGGGATGNFFGTDLPHGIGYYDWVKLLPNTHYVYQAKIWSNAAFGGHGSVPLHYWFSYDAANQAGDGYTILDYQQNVSLSQTWTQCYVHFVTGNSNIFFKPYIWHSGITTSIFVTELMLSQSRVVQPWSPHPSEVYSGITQIDKDGIRVHHSNANSYTHMAPDGFFVNNNGTDVVQVTASGLYVQGNITSGSTIQGARITGSTFNSSNDVFQVLEDGSIETSFLAVNGAVSTDKLNVNDIENASYPKVLTEATTVYISPNGGVNSEEFYDGAYFTSLSNMLAVAPRNLNGYTLTIRMAGDLYENAALTWFHSGQVNFEMQGYTLYGYFYGYGASMCYRLYGNTNADSSAWGHIKPNVGRAMGKYYYAVQFQYCQFAVNYVAVYPSASSGSSSGGIGVHRGATGNIFTAKACGDMRYLVRAEYAGRVHVNETQGACNNSTFCATTGGIITLNSSNNQAGRSTSGKPYSVSSGGLILCDQLLGMDKITFNNTSQSGSSSSSGSTTRKVTETVKASSADTYRSTVYNNWKGDGTVRQGDYGHGDCQGCWFFGNNLYTTMNAGTVTKVVIRIQRQSGGVNALQTLTVKSHNHTSRPSGAPTYTDTIGTCSCAVGSSIDLVITDSTTINKLKKCKGLGLSIGSASSPYAVCSGACSVIITYTTNS